MRLPELETSPEDPSWLCDVGVAPGLASIVNGNLNRLERACLRDRRILGRPVRSIRKLILRRNARRTARAVCS